MSLMAAKKKPKSKAKPKRPVAKPKSKTKPAAKRVQPKAKRAAVPKKAKPRAASVKPQPKAKPVETPKPVAVTPPPAPPVAVSPTLVRPGLQKRADLPPIGVVRVTDGYQLIEESTFYSAPGRDEYVQRWEARGYTCRFTPTTNGSLPD
jgi:hypothetical protein